MIKPNAGEDVVEQAFRKLLGGKCVYKLGKQFGTHSRGLRQVQTLWSNFWESILNLGEHAHAPKDNYACHIHVKIAMNQCFSDFFHYPLVLP